MMMNEFGARRGYDYDNADGWVRHGRGYDPRYDGYGRRYGGDWMRESPWMRDGAWQNEPMSAQGGLWGQGLWGQGGLWGREPGWTREGYWAPGPRMHDGYSGLRGQEGYSWGQGPRVHEGGYEPIVRVIEVLAESPHSWEDATRRAIAEASQTVRGIRSIYIKDMQAIVEDDRVLGFRVNAKIAFTQEDGRRRR